MSDVNWTPQQRAAIEDRGGTLLVSAAAGSGKTAVLTQRVIGLVCDENNPVDANRLLIVTFTVAAAAELRARIARALDGEIAKDPGSTRLRRQKMLLQRADICTVDSLCQRLVRENFTALDIPPDFAKGDDVLMAELKKQTMADVLEEAFADPDFCTFADQYGKGRSDQDVANTITDLDRFLSSMPWPEQTAEDFAAGWASEVPFADTPWAKYLRQEADRILDEMAGLAQQGFTLTRDIHDEEIRLAVEGKKGPAAIRKAEETGVKRADNAVLCFSLWKDLLIRLRQSGWDEAVALLKEPCPAIDPHAKFKLAEYKEARNIAAALKKQAEKLAEKIFHITEAEFEEDRRTAAPMVAALVRAWKRYHAELLRRKIEKKQFEFGDIAHFALNLLWADGRRTELCETIGSRYAAIMVDEYQDTNRLQDTLYHCLAKPDGSNLFFVGDLKQSIYRFRQAEPSVFTEKLEQYAPLPGEQPRADGRGEAAQLALDRNFRSAPGTVAGINYFFEQLMSRELGGTEYGDGQRLVCGVESDFAGSVTVLFSSPKEVGKKTPDAEKPDEIPGAEGIELVSNGEPELLARRIAEMLQQGVPVRDGSAPDGVRPCQPGDFCILCSSRNQFELYRQALLRLEIPVHADMDDNLMEVSQNGWLAELLRTLDNPARDVSLAAALLSPLFGCTEDDLVRLRTLKRKGSLYAALLAGTREEGDFGRRMTEVRETIARLRDQAATLPVDRLLEEILIETGFLAAVGALPGGDERRQETQTFVRWCCQSVSLPELVRRLDAAREGKIKVTGGETGPLRTGCVNIITIHKSKGLEFPIVIVADTTHQFNESDLYRKVLFHRDLGIGLQLRVPGGNLYNTAARDAIRMKLDTEEKSEKMRLLYVAMTRAKDHLILSVCEEKTMASCESAAKALHSGQKGSYLRSTKNFALWLYCAALVHPDGEALRAMVPPENLPVPADTASRLTVEVLGDAEVGTAAVQQHTGRPEGQADPALVQRLEQRFAWQYPHSGLCALPVKLTVSQLVHPYTETLSRPGFMSRTDMTAAEQGTATHAFLQYADFEALEQGRLEGDLAGALQREADRQWSRRLLDGEVRDKLNWESLEAFVRSSAFRRILSAQRIRREFDFITALPAETVQQDAPAGSTVLVQGIADLVLEFADHMEILDYKTDRNKTDEEFLAAYAGQLRLYAAAIDRRFAGKPVTYMAVIALESGREIPVEQA